MFSHASVKVDTGGEAVTAVETAWDRVYTASGPSGVIKAWTPLWEDATKEKVRSHYIARWPGRVAGKDWGNGVIHA